MIPDRTGADADVQLSPRASAVPVAGTRAGCTCLMPFDRLYAQQVSSWVLSDRELEWLAPGTLAPLTAHKVAAWGGNGSNRFLYWREGDDSPGAYGELNRMPDRTDQMWIGHVVVAPDRRGRAYGADLSAALVNRAFVVHRVSAVLLVVFPENEHAVRCYKRIGMVEMGRERKRFKTTRREYTFLRMGMDGRRFRALVACGVLSGRPLSVRSRAAARAGLGAPPTASVQSKRIT